MTGWRIYYPDSVITSKDSNPYEVPEGIVGIVQYYDLCTICNPVRYYRDIVHNADWYCFDGRWFGVPTHPIPGRWVLKEDAENLYPDAVLLQSAPMLNDEAWDKIHEDMIQAKEPP